MSKEFLFASWEGGGNIPPMLTVVRRLLARGHKVRVLGDDASADEIRRAGAEFRPWRNAPNRPDRRPASDPQKDWRIKDARELLPVLLDTMVTGPALGHAMDVIDEVMARRVDVLVASDFQLGALAGAEAAGVPAAILACNLPYLPRAGVPPFGAGLLPAADEEEERRHGEIGEAFGGLFQAGLVPLNAARARLGLDPLETLADQLHRADLHLVASAEAFDYPAREQPANLRYIGPLLDTPAWVETWEHEWDLSRPLVLVAFSTTYQKQLPILRNVVAALSRLPVNALVTAGPACAGLALKGRRNVRVVSSGSHDAILARASLCITHCGHGTVMRALSAGVPILGMPMGRDQNDNAARVAWHGAGIRIEPTSGAPEISGALRRLIDEPAYPQNARLLGERIRAESQPHRAAEMIEALARAN